LLHACGIAVVDDKIHIFGGIIGYAARPWTCTWSTIRVEHLAVSSALTLAASLAHGRCSNERSSTPSVGYTNVLDETTAVTPTRSMTPRRIAGRAAGHAHRSNSGAALPLQGTITRTGGFGAAPILATHGGV